MMNISLINDDCLNAMSKISDNTIDLVVTSPPYNCNIDYNSYNDNRPWEEYLDWCQRWINELYRICKDDGRIAINVLFEMGINNNKTRVSPMRIFSEMIEKAGFTIMAIPMWTDNHRVKFTAWGSWKSASCPYIYNPFEVIILAYKKVNKKQNKGINTISKEDFMMGCSGIWKLKTDTNSLTKATFPVSLPKLAIELLSYKGDLILDPFVGSGTTAIACLETERDCIGIEIDKDYYDIALDRLNKSNFIQEDLL